MRRIYLLVLLLLTCYHSIASELPAKHTSDPLLLWTTVLENFVDQQGRTDFKALQASGDTLRHLTNYLATHGPQSNPAQFQSEAAQLAFHINAYNALAMQAVIDKDISKGFNSVFKRLRFFRWHTIRVDGKEMSLHDYENDVIRSFNEPRIHFVLNCMVRDCPRLPQRAFQAEQLESQLEQATQEFFNKRKHLYINAATSTVYVSEILSFYTKDFVSSGETQALAQYINRYRDVRIPDNYSIEFIPYDWTINQQP